MSDLNEEEGEVKVAADTRYQNVANIDSLPNEYQIEDESGVYDTLTSLPLYSELVPSAKKNKKTYLYDLYARPTLAFDPMCQAGNLDAALNILNRMPSSIDSDMFDLNTSVRMTALSFMAI